MYINIYIYIYIHDIPSLVQAAPRTTARTGSTTRRARPACGGAPPRAGKAAHTPYNVVTDAVFHAPMFALNADA